MNERETTQQRRRSDAIDRWISFAIIAAIIAMTFWFKLYTHDHNVQRTQDLRAQCRRTSAKTASDVNLNWVYWQSEAKLSRSPIGSVAFRKALAALDPSERKFLMLLISGSQPSSSVLNVRANADFDAAYVKAKTVDYHDAGLISRSTPLGSGEKPYRWVIEAHYSCAQAFR